MFLLELNWDNNTAVINETNTASPFNKALWDLFEALPKLKIATLVTEEMAVINVRRVK
jgi:hypothetical protein